MKWVPLGLRVQTWNIWQKSNISGSWHAWISSNISNLKCKNKAEINVTSVSRSCKIMNIFAKDRIFHNKPDQDAAPRSSKSYTVQDNWVTNMVILKSYNTLQMYPVSVFLTNFTWESRWKCQRIMHGENEDILMTINWYRGKGILWGW